MSNVTKGQTVGYLRVSSTDQNAARQESQLNEYNPDLVFIDKASGKDRVRPELKAAIKHLRNGDRLIVTSMDRLARNLDDLRAIVSELTSKGVAVQFLKESMTFTGDDSSMSKLLLSVMGAFAEFERSLIKERQLEGIALAKANGAYKGRKPTMTPERIIELIAKDSLNGNKNRAALATESLLIFQTL